jgi:hypothetical protein
VDLAEYFHDVRQVFVAFVFGLPIHSLAAVIEIVDLELQRTLVLGRRHSAELAGKAVSLLGVCSTDVEGVGK